MARVTEAGFYDGKFLKAGQSHDGPAPEADLDGMTKDELLAEAERRGIEIASGSTKAEILTALKG